MLCYSARTLPYLPSTDLFLCPSTQQRSAKTDKSQDLPESKYSEHKLILQHAPTLLQCPRPTRLHATSSNVASVFQHDICVRLESPQSMQRHHGIGPTNAAVSGTVDDSSSRAASEPVLSPKVLLSNAMRGKLYATITE